MKTILWGACFSCACTAAAPTLEPEPYPAATAAVPASASASAPAPAQSAALPKNAFRFPDAKRVVGVAGAGDAVFFSVGAGFRDEDGHVGRLTRAGDVLSHRGPATHNLRVFGQGAQTSAIAIGAQGGVAIFKNGDWEYRLAPALEAEALGSATLADNGEVYVAGNKHALYALSADGLSWKTFRYSMTVDGVRAAVSVGKGIRLVLNSGEVHEFSNGAFQRVTIHGLTVGSLATDTQDSWIDDKNKTVWLAGSESLTMVDLANNKASTHRSGLFHSLQAISGVDTPKGTLIAVSTFADSGLFDGSDFYALDEDGADALFIDARNAHAYLLGHSGVKVVEIKHPWLGTGKGKVLPPR